MEKKNTGLIILVIILSLLVLGLSGYIVYDKVLSNDDTSNDIQNVSNDCDDDVTEKNYSIWTDYILGQNIKSISLERVDEGQAETLNVNLTKEQLNDIFAKFNEGTLTKRYVGGWGFTGGYVLTIKYESDNKNYEFVMRNDRFTEDGIDDQKLLGLIISNVSSIAGEENKGTQGVFVGFIVNHNVNFSTYFESN